ncbi:MAG: DUF2793 domain-containing protein [Pseudomonadota bacterium]
MPDTTQLNLPLLSPSQAQKHVTVNEALSRLDGLVQLRLQSVELTVPPAVFDDGVCYGIPAGASGDWSGQSGRLALAVNGGWEFVDARRGFRAYVLDTGASAIFDGTDWRLGAVTQTTNGAGLSILSRELDVALSSGGSVTTPVAFPARSLVFGVTGRVTQAITGAPSLSLGVAADTTRYGTGLNTAANSWISGPSTPLVYWSDTALLVTSEGADFNGGALKLVAHYAVLDPPKAI